MMEEVKKENSSRHLLYLLVVVCLLNQFCESANSTDFAGNCSDCAEDEAPCPFDSTLNEEDTCMCDLTRCVQPVCKYGSIKELKRHGNPNEPGNCCDVYECTPPREKNCSKVICPEQTEGCPSDSFRLPRLRKPEDCCSHSQGCQCLPIACPEPKCAAGETAVVTRHGDGKPGTCCSEYTCVQQELNDTCLVEGGIKKNGTKWWKNKCTQCSCDNGQVFCGVYPLCPEIEDSCSRTHVPPGECCPICVEVAEVAEGDGAGEPGGCFSSTGKIPKNGEVWQEDPCTTCECVAGEKKCQAHMCYISCDHPRHVPGECCPTCDESSVVTIPPHCPALHNCSLRCLHGFVRDSAGCYRCQCQAEECLLECPGGYKQDHHGNNLCECANTVATVIPPADCPPLTNCRKNCSHGFRLSKAGCEMCKCNHCRSLNDCHKDCVYGLRTNDRGCPICKCKASLDEHTASSDSIITGTCTSSDGKHHDDGETWFDGCRQCYCHGGAEMCNLITCPAVTCKDPIFNSTEDCCPHCADKQLEAEQHMSMVCQSVDGASRVEGETWQMNACTRCLCHLGRVLCESKKCPPAPCPNPILQPGKCCPECREDLFPKEESDKCCGLPCHGDIWMKDPCYSCKCDNGQTFCYAQQCHNVSCSHPVLVKNQCCPLCLDDTVSKSCIVGNISYGSGEEWSEDPCMRCKCIDGHKLCTEKVCSISCINAVKKPGKCCPICIDSAEAKAEDVTYIVVIVILLAMVACLTACVTHQWCKHRRQLQLDDNGSPKSCPNPAYHGYALPPPHYQYKYVPTYDSSDVLKSPSIGASEKSALASVKGLEYH